MRYESITKVNRNKSLIQVKLASPDLSLKELGEIFGISKQRVCQILRRYTTGVSNAR